MSKEVLLDVRHLTQQFHLTKKIKVKAVDDVSFQIHKGEIFGLVGESGSGKSTVARCLMNIYQPAQGEIWYKDVNICDWNPLQKGQTIEADGITYTPEMVLGPARKGIRLTYTTDTRPTESILRNAKESDLFICEGMYGEDDKADKARGYKHMTFREAAVLARDARVKEMWLTHYSPSLVRPDEFMDKVREIFPNAYPGKDGKSLELNFEE